VNASISTKNVFKKFLERKATSRLHRLIPKNRFWEESDQCLQQRGTRGDFFQRLHVAFVSIVSTVGVFSCYFMALLNPKFLTLGINTTYSSLYVCEPVISNTLMIHLPGHSKFVANWHSLWGGISRLAARDPGRCLIRQDPWWHKNAYTFHPTVFFCRAQTFCYAISFTDRPAIFLLHIQNLRHQRFHCTSRLSMPILSWAIVI
jgi:hypothetical protein